MGNDHKKANAAPAFFLQRNLIAEEAENRTAKDHASRHMSQTFLHMALHRTEHGIGKRMHTQRSMT